MTASPRARCNLRQERDELGIQSRSNEGEKYESLTNVSNCLDCNWQISAGSDVYTGTCAQVNPPQRLETL